MLKIRQILKTGLLAYPQKLFICLCENIRGVLNKPFSKVQLFPQKGMMTSSDKLEQEETS